MVVTGSPTVVNGIIHGMAGFIQMMKEMKFKGKKATSFGCYGWSGESVKIMNELLASAGFDVFDEGIRQQWNPDDDAETAIVEFGKKIALVD